MRVNNVRKAFEFWNPEKFAAQGFYDSSLWESRKCQGDDSLKSLVREGVQYTSVVAVLIGSLTWSRRWVRYEIARSIIDQKGLLGVHINSINHHERLKPDARGLNPIAFMGITKTIEGAFRLCEIGPSGNWQFYQDHTYRINLPKYLREPTGGSVVSLNSGTIEYDFALQNGHKNIGGWLDFAAKGAGR
jgi:hypothetical protein